MTRSEEVVQGVVAAVMELALEGLPQVQVEEEVEVEVDRIAYIIWNRA
jgi:hypothetical protein